ncbi:MAG TPA: DeoR/GlpR family DNA-binding transcription regulator [Anaerolineaceae bacterium]|nr:DeoR/GlpR family DNA-binding transcription regulator [Anaerolineaceae bacterium]
MLAKERHQQIVDLLEKNSSITVTELVNRFGTSEMTIRRDLDILEKRFLLRRVHGGAVSARGSSYEPPYISRVMENSEIKQRIGKAAAGLVKSGDSISLDTGTTTYEVARHIAEMQDLTVITHSYPIASLLMENLRSRLICSGGIVRAGELSMIGDLAIRTYQEYFVDKLFLGVGGIDIKIGLTEFNLEDTLVKRAMVQNAKEVIVVADASKFNQVAFTLVAPIRVVRKIVTDTSLDPSIVTQLEKEGIEVILV